MQRPPSPRGCAAMSFRRFRLALGHADARDARALVSEQELGVGPAAILLADEVFDRHAHVLEPDLVDLSCAVEQRDRAHRDARALHVDQQEADAGLRLRLGVGAHQTEDPIGVVPQGIPGLLAVDHVVIALAHRPRAQRGKIRARPRLRVPLAPPSLARADRRQEPALLSGAAEGDQHRRDHLHAERQDARRIRHRRFLFEYVLLHGIPGGAAELPGPRHRAPTAIVQASLPAQVLGTLERHAAAHLVAKVLRKMLAQEGAHFLAERALLPGELEMHGRIPISLPL